MAYLVEKHRSLIPAIVFHFFWDFTMLGMNTYFIGGLHVDPFSYFQAATVGGALVLTYLVVYLKKK